MAIDRNTLDIRAREVSESLRSYLTNVTKAVSDHLDEHSIQQAESLRANAEKLDKNQSDRDSSVLKDVAEKTQSMRDDVRRFGEEREAAQGKMLEGAVEQAMADLRSEMADLHKQITEDIAAAVRSTYERLMSEITGKGWMS